MAILPLGQSAPQNSVYEMSSAIIPPQIPAAYRVESTEAKSGHFLSQMPATFAAAQILDLNSALQSLKQKLPISPCSQTPFPHTAKMKNLRWPEHVEENHLCRLI